MIDLLIYEVVVETARRIGSAIRTTSFGSDFVYDELRHPLIPEISCLILIPAKYCIPLSKLHRPFIRSSRSWSCSILILTEANLAIPMLECCSCCSSHQNVRCKWCTSHQFKRPVSRLISGFHALIEGKVWLLLSVPSLKELHVFCGTESLMMILLVLYPRYRGFNWTFLQLLLAAQVLYDLFRQTFLLGACHFQLITFFESGYQIHFL